MKSVDKVSPVLTQILAKDNIRVFELLTDGVAFHMNIPSNFVFSRKTYDLLKGFFSPSPFTWEGRSLDYFAPSAIAGLNQSEDPVNHPSHYNSGKIEVIEFIFDQGFGPDFCKGNAIKYTARAGKKEGVDELQDIEKAAWYLQYLAERIKAEREGRTPLRPNELNKGK